MRLVGLGLVLLAVVVASVLLTADVGRTVVGPAGLALFVGCLARGIFSVRSSLLEPTAWRSCDPGERRVALSFDDGPHPEFTPAVLDALDAAGVKATFFLVGANVRAHPELAQRIVAAGHEVACHADSHTSTTPWFGAARLRQELTDCLAAVRAATGRTPRLYRPPFGIRTPPQVGVPASEDLIVVGMARRGLDRNPGSTIERVVARTVECAHGGEILALHDGDEPRRTQDRCLAAEALPQILAGLAARGLDVVPVSTLLSERPYRESPSRGWTGRSGGGHLAHRVAIRLIRWFGPGICSPLLHPIALVFVATAGSARAASIRFRRRLHGPAPWWRELGWAYRHFHVYAQLLARRMAFLADGGAPPDAERENFDAVRETFKQPGGLLLVSAHLGDYISPSRLVELQGRDLYVVAFKGMGLGPHQVRRDAQNAPFEIIDVEQSPLTVGLAMATALTRGGIVAMLGDRVMGTAAVRVPFLGGEAEFPAGPWAVALTTRVPVVVFFAIPLPRGRVRMIAYDPIVFLDPREVGREAAIRAAVTTYAQHLEDCVRRYPLHWGNFFDVWPAT